MQLKNRPAVTKTVEITINPIETKLVAYIKGADKLRLNRKESYSLVTDDGTINNEEVTFEIQEDPHAKRPPSDYATLTQALDDNGEKISNKYILHANAKNKLGSVVLIATYQGEEYTKTVDIIPLW
jgi:hypothetical protein